MCNCFEELKQKIKLIAQQEFPNNEIINIKIGRGFNSNNEVGGYVDYSVSFRSNTPDYNGNRGIFRRNNSLGFKDYSKTRKCKIDTSWKYCPLCGEKL